MPKLISAEDFKRIRSQYAIKHGKDKEYRNMLLDISNFMSPRRGRFLQQRDNDPKAKGSKRQYIYDDTASRAHLITAAGMKGGLCPHSLPWFKIKPRHKELADEHDAKTWLNEVEKGIYSILSRSNFYATATSVFTEQVLFGTAPISIDEDESKHIVCRSWTAGEYTLISDGNGRIRTAYREMYLSPASMIDLWGTDLPDDVIKANETAPFDHMKVIHAVFDKFASGTGSIGSAQMPVGSLFWLEGSDKEPLHEGGFESFPVMFPRWSQIAEDDYGSDCPGMATLNDVKTLQEVRKDILTMSKRAAFPSMVAPAHLKGRLKNFPGAINYVNETTTKLRNLEEQQQNIAPLYEMQRDLQMRVEKGFFNDLFLMILTDKNMTATEVARRHEDKLTILGSVVERQNSEFLSPSIERVFQIGMSKQLFPEPPPSLQGEELDIEFVSLLSQAQRMVGTQAIERTMGFAMQAAELNPEVVDVFDFDEALRRYADGQGADPKLTRPVADVDKIRGDRADQQQEAAAAEQGLTQAKTAAAASQAKLGENSVLDQVLSEEQQ